MICPKHPSEGDCEVCKACLNGNPPDLGVQIEEETTTTEHISGG